MNVSNWTNVPVPEGHIVALVLGTALHIWRPIELLGLIWLGHAFAWPILFLCMIFIAWAVASARGIRMEEPLALITSGPYGFSRNPMYLAWNGIYLAIALLVNTWWLVILLPGLLLFTHYFVIRREEILLERQFGEQYREYCARVPRYL